MDKGQIIFLNGAPSAGKTTIARALQDILEEPYLYIGIDDVYRMLPARYQDWDDPDHHQTVFQAVSGLNHCIVTLASIGNNTVVDYLMYDGFEGYYLAECVFLLAHYSVLFVAIRCDLDELEHRQRQRSDRNPNFTREYLASAQIRAHAHGIYDLEVDTTHLTPHQCAEIIKAHLRNGPKPEAFRRIRDKYISI